MGSFSYSTERKKEVHYTLVHNTTITAVHNIHSSVQHIETFRLPERQVASTMISVLAGTLTSWCWGGGKKHCVKTEQTLSALRPRNCRSNQ